jgi:hypothetical protein
MDGLSSEKTFKVRRSAVKIDVWEAKQSTHVEHHTPALYASSVASSDSPRIGRPA